ncbi:MAG: response regulator [Chthoniobacter sp.]
MNEPHASKSVDALSAPLASPLFQSRSKILILTHDMAGVQALKDVIEHAWEIPVVVATDAEHATLLFHRMHPDLIVLDHEEAAHFLWQVRQDRRPDGFLPALVLVANEDAKAKHEAMVAGATDFLTKPVDATEAMMRIHNLLALREARQNSAGIAAADSADAPPVPLPGDRLAQLRGQNALLAPPDRLHVLGTMASGIAHDFNNILTIVMGFAEQLLLEGQSLSLADRQDLLRTIVLAAHDGADMVERLREYQLPVPADQVYQPVDLNRLIEQSIALTRPKWHADSRTQGSNIIVRRDLSDLPPIHGHPAELREMLTNLIFNAVDAMPQGGTLTLRTAREAGQIVLEVHDSGMGMSDRVRRHCREPFFTTKGHHGTGMGLPMVQSTAERHGAILDIESETGKGTVFRLRFNDPAPRNTESPQRALGSLDILVVDDEPMVCELTARLLADAGHRVRTAPDPHEALRMAAAGSFDLVVTDRAMPLMNGERLASAIKAACPATRILLATGSTGGEMADGSFDGILAKPFTSEALRSAVAGIFAGTRAGMSGFPSVTGQGM